MTAPARTGPASRRAVDHLVLPFATLDEARATFEVLGFTVAPDAVHPFGTANACVYFATGPYLEPLAIGNADAYGLALGTNPFVERDAAFRAGQMLPGVSALAIGSADAAADRERLKALGCADDRFVEFSRLFRSPEGTDRRLGFRLAFASAAAASDPALFFCQALHAEAPDRSHLTRHPNGASAIRRLVLAPQPGSGERPSLAELLGVSGGGDGEPAGGVRLAGMDPAIEVLASDALAGQFGAAASAAAGVVGIVLGARNLQAAARLLGARAQAIGPRLVVPFGRSGRFIAFEEDPSP